MHNITGSTVSIKAAAPANMSFRQGSYRPSTLLAAWWALLQFAGTQAAVSLLQLPVVVGTLAPCTAETRLNSLLINTENTPSNPPTKLNSQCPHRFSAHNFTRRYHHRNF